MLIGPLAALIFADPPANRSDRSKASRVEGARSDSARSTAVSEKRGSSKNGRVASGGGAEKQVEPLSREREENAIRFAREHHPELAELLEGLRKSDNPNFHAGLHDLARDAERLGKLGERDQERYSVSLRSWKLDSRIRLEIARLSMSSEDDFEARLRPMMEERQAARIQSLRLEQKRLSERLAKTEEQLANLKKNPTELVSAEIARLHKLVTARTRASSARTQASRESAETKQRTTRETKTSRNRRLPTTSAD